MSLEFSLYIFRKGSINRLTSNLLDTSTVHLNPSVTRKPSPDIRSVTLDYPLLPGIFKQLFLQQFPATMEA